MSTCRSGRSSMRLLELMPKRRGSGSGNNPDRETFITIDDLTAQAEELATGLRILGDYKHPLDIRRGVSKHGKGVKQKMSKERESRQVKGAGRTYFFDVEKTRAGRNYLKITESHKDKEKEDKFVRSSILVFPEDAETFAEAVGEMTTKIN